MTIMNSKNEFMEIRDLEELEKDAFLGVEELDPKIDIATLAQEPIVEEVVEEDEFQDEFDELSSDFIEAGDFVEGDE
jgi:hypothetical protein